MYRISENKRIQRSALLIRDALLSCLEEKSLSEITISDIQRISGVSRSTFYRIFDNLIDVLSYHCELLLQATDIYTNTFLPQNQTEFIINTLRFWQNNYLFLETIYANRLDHILRNILLNLLQKYCKNEHSENFSMKHAEYMFAGTTGFLVGILMTWVKHGKQESAEELYEIFCQFHFSCPCIESPNLSVN